MAAGPRPDLLLCDYRLVGRTGVEVVRRVRQAVDEDLPSIILTGDTSRREIEEAGLPNCAVVHKPVDPDRLLDLVRSMLP